MSDRALTTCGYCGHRFDVEEGRRSCHACSLVGGGCRSLRCPRCGYENPEEPRALGWLRRLFGREKERA